MPRFPVFAVAFLLALGAAAPLAARNQDMFANEGYFGTGRPWVPSDRDHDYTHRGDMFQSPDIFLHTGKDMFGFMQRPGSLSIERRFSAHLDYIPDRPLFHWPKDAPYP